MAVEAIASAPTLKVGGTLNPERNIYIERQEDKELLRLLLAGEFVNVVAPRQMGKSSLVMRTQKVLRDKGLQTVMIDLTEVGTPDNAAAYFIGILNGLARELKLGIDVAGWWSESEAGGTASQRLQAFFREVVLPIVNQRLIIFIDEIDSSLKFPFADDLFTSIRWLFNERAKSQEYEKLAFCLIGVAAPNELIKDRRTTPYNIGHFLALNDFSGRDGLQEFLPRLHGRRDVLERILYWSGGQPYLVALLADVIEKSEDPSPSAVDRYVEQKFTALDSLRDDTHFVQVLRFIETRLRKGLESLSTYGRVLKGERIKAQPTQSHLELQLSGLVKRDDTGCLMVRNPIYARLFDRKWLEALLPRAAETVVRPYRRRLVIVSSVAAVLLVAAAIPLYLYRASQVQETQLSQQLRDLRSKGIEVSRDADNLFFVSITNSAPDDVLGTLIQAGVDPLSVSRLDARDIQKKATIDLRWIAAMRNLQELDLTGSQITDITVLQGLAKLRTLTLPETKVEDIGPLRGLVNLEDLNLRQTSVRDIEVLSLLTNLRHLSLEGTGVTKVEALRSNAELTDLNLARTVIDDLTPLSGLTKLQVLDVALTSVRDIKPLRNLTNLTELWAGGSEIADFSVLKGFPNLEVLSASYTPVSDFETIGELRTLGVLVLGGTDISDLRPIAELNNLTMLYLNNTEVADISLLEKLPMLRYLDLSESNITDISPVRHLTDLVSLDISQTKVSSIAALQGLPELRELDIFETEVTDLSPLIKLYGLTKINMSEPSGALDTMDTLRLRGVEIQYSNY